MGEGDKSMVIESSESGDGATDGGSILDGKTPEEKESLKRAWRQRVKGFEWADYLRRKDLQELTVEQSMKDYSDVLRASAAFSRRSIINLRGPEPSESLLITRRLFDLAGRDRKNA